MVADAHGSVGEQLGRYRLEARIGSGGMGEVYRARDLRLPRLVAIKILPSHLRQSSERRARFEREARTVSRLMHPHICTLLDVGREGDVDFLVMEYLDGETLAARLTQGPLPLDRALQLGIEIAAALAHLHRHGVVHRDLKPSNVMLTAGGAKLLDFGIAKVGPGDGTSLATSSVSTTTQEGTLVGTLAYMAPEQLQGREADARSDIWAFGCVLFEALTGRRAFEGESQATLIAAILDREPTPLSTLQPITPPLLHHLVHTCLAKDMDARWQSAADIERELRWVDHPSVPLTPWVAPMVRVLSRRRARRVAAGVVVTALLLAGARRVLRAPAEPDAFRISTAVAWPSAESRSRLSPDGRWLSFVSDRDGEPRLFMQNIRSGEVRPVEAPPGAVLGAVWSPDGQELALLLRQPEGTAVQIVPAFFGGTGRALARVPEPARLVRWLRSTIYVDRRYALIGVETASGSLSDVLRPDPARWPLARGFDVSSDGRIVFTADVGGNADIWSTTLNGATPERLTDDPASDVNPVLAGDYLYFQSNRGGQGDVWRQALSARRLTRVTASASDLVPDDATADGKLVSVSTDAIGSEVWMLNRSTGLARAVTADSAQDLWPSRSRDATVVAYQRRKGSLDTAYLEGQAEIVVGRWNGIAIVDTRLVAPAGFSPSLSSDGRRLAYLEWVHKDSDFYALKLLDLASGQARTLSERFVWPGYFEFPVDLLGRNVAWSEDGSLFFGERDAGGLARIVRVAANGGEPQPVVTLASVRESIHDVSLAPDGRRLGYRRFTPERSVFVVRELTTGAQTEWLTDAHGRLGALFCLGWDGGRPILARSRRSGLQQSMDVLALSGPNQPVVLRRLTESYPATARLDAGAHRVLITLREGRADNLFAVPLGPGEPQRLTSNDQPSVSFSNVDLGADGLMLFARHDRKQDIWLVRVDDH